jgi:hypothetical protein
MSDYPFNPALNLLLLKSLPISLPDLLHSYTILDRPFLCCFLLQIPPGNLNYIEIW